MASQRLSSYLALILLLRLVGAQNKDGLNICRRYGHQTTILDGKLYIDGGWTYNDPLNAQSKPTPNRNLIYSDLGQLDGDMPAQSSLQKEALVPSVAGGILWADEVNKVFWQYGGEFANANAAIDFEMWGYDTFMNRWNTSTPHVGSANVARVSYGAGTALDGIGYYYGGYLSNLTVPSWSGPPIATSNLIRYDMDNAMFYNESGADNTGRAEGVMVSIPISNKGMLVYFGGIQASFGTISPMPLSQILLYDINESQWFTQPASGDIPADRRKFCAGAAWTKDGSSFNIYIYGGFGFGVNASGFDDVYILSLPTFTWIKWYPGEGNYTPNPHGDLTCNVVKNSQMIVMGGNFTSSNVCDSAAKNGAQHNLRLAQNTTTDRKWAEYFTNFTTYVVPPAVIAVAGGNGNGGATNTRPASGQFVDSRLNTYFTQTARAAVRTPTRYLPATTSSSSGSHKSNIGAIAGGAVAGVVVIALVIFLAWRFCLRKKPRARSEPARINELVGDPRLDMKPSTMVLTSPSSPHSGHATPYSAPPPQGYPPYAYAYPVPQQFYPMPMQQAMYFPQSMYVPGSPPDGFYSQQGFCPTQQMQGNMAHEMPITALPGGHSSPTSGQGSTVHESLSDHGAKERSPTHKSY